MPKSWMVGSLSVFLACYSLIQAESKDGARRWTRKVPKSSEVVYRITFLADKTARGIAEFAVMGDGSTDVDIEVYDAKGQLIAKDEYLTDLAVARWKPAVTQEYTIKVKNLGTEDNVCHMGHN